MQIRKFYTYSYTMYINAKSEKEKNNILIDYAPHFDEFNVEFRVARKYISAKDYSSKRLELLKLIFDYFLPEIKNKRSPDIVQEFTSIVKQNGLAVKAENSENHQFILSPISKSAFLVNPTLYFPYDSKAQTALNIYIRENGLKYWIHKNYVNYMNVYNKVFEIIYKSITREYISNQVFLNSLEMNFDVDYERFMLRINRIKEICIKLDIDDVYEFISRRAVDKALMLQGGFEDYKLVAFKQRYLVRK